MKKTFLCGCQKCGARWDEYKEDYKDPASTCPECGSDFTKTIPFCANTPREFKPYDLLDRPIPDGKKIKSFNTDHRKKPGA